MSLAAEFNIRTFYIVHNEEDVVGHPMAGICSGKELVLVCAAVRKPNTCVSTKSEPRRWELEREDGCLLGCSSMYTGISLPTFQRSVLPPSSGRRSEAERAPEALESRRSRMLNELANYSAAIFKKQEHVSTYFEFTDHQDFATKLPRLAQLCRLQSVWDFRCF
jgi:hypothetical protein